MFYSNFLQISLLFIFYLPTLIKTSEDCPNHYISCSSTCVPTLAQCPTIMKCKKPYILLNQYLCDINGENSIPSKCKKNLECWEGKCVSSQNEKVTLCPSMTSCPDSYVRCYDDSCVTKEEECPNYIKCPSFIPIRCPNGDCRRSLNDCPTIITCPKEFAVKCNDGSCHRTKNECNNSNDATKCPDVTMTRCSDGSCTNSKFLCPSQVTCPEGFIKCFDGNCRKECNQPSLTQISTCSNNNDIVCPFDFSCRSDKSLCPTGIICPIDKPVKCWDMSCKESLSQCPEFQSCPSTMHDCPDGSCSMKETCGTHITCSMDAPFRCFDNTCRRSPDDCPQMPNCPSDSPILCWDGRCLANRGDCLPPTLCDSSNPVKCADNICAKSLDSCKEINDCPSQFIKCPDGTCMKKMAYCINQQCPLSFPYKCNNGMCVTHESHCEKENGCPYNKPNKCPNGECVSDNCNNKDKKCPSDKKLCPDGSCLPTTKACPKENGCPSDTPLRCADGTCIDPKKAECPIPVCPSEKPIRCDDGICVTTKSYCTNNNHKYINNSKPLCANGIEVDFFEECKLIIPCSSSEIRCEDGTCREKLEYCPDINTCPEEYNIRCKDGSCAKSEDLCLHINGCPQNKNLKCPNSGLCVKDDLDLCDLYNENFKIGNGCDSERPFKCPITGKCVMVEDECVTENGCPLDNPYMCQTGQCVSNKRRCAGYDDDELCLSESDRPYLCIYDTDAQCSKKPDECFNSQNCRINEPFRCPSGECKRYPYIPGGDSIKSCDISIYCPEYKPFLCADGSCAEKSSFCKSEISCYNEDDSNSICFDRTCQKYLGDCDKHKKCPAKNPILCQNGNCVSSIFDCQENSCPTWMPYKCIYGKCKKAPHDCILQNDENHNPIYKSYCQENEVTCYDGTCRLNIKDCPIYAGCPTSELPYKCNDGSCEKDEKSCLNITIKCEGDLILSVDGICRNITIPYNGCPNYAPLLCSTGHCVKTFSECVGESSCPSVDTPFRCIDGSCVSSISQCKSSIRNFGVSNLRVEIYPNIDANIPFVIGDSNLIIGNLYIPSDSIRNVNGNIHETAIYLRSVPRNEIPQTYYEYDSTRYNDIISAFPYADSNENSNLDYEYNVLSSVVNFSFVEENYYIYNPLLLTLLYDFPEKYEKLHNIRNSSDINSFKFLNKTEDVCLAKLNKSFYWNCLNSASKTESLSKLQLQGRISEPGIYAVILSPVKNDAKLEIKKNNLIEFRYAITITSIILIIIIGSIIYIFYRIYRFRGKYKKTTKLFKSLEFEMNDLQLKSTDIIGQTIGDTKEGVIFTDNPCYKIKNDSKNLKTIQLEKRYDDYLKKLKILEKNNKTLTERLDEITTQYEELVKVKEELNLINKKKEDENE